MTGSLMLRGALGPRASAISLHIDFMVFFNLSKARVPCKGLRLLSGAHQEQEESVPSPRPQDDADSRDLCPGILHSSHRHPSSASETHPLSQPPVKETGNKQADHVAGTCPRSGQALEGSSPPQAQHHRIRAADLGGVAKASSQAEATGVYT